MVYNVQYSTVEINWGGGLNWEKIKAKRNLMPLESLFYVELHVFYPFYG